MGRHNQCQFSLRVESLSDSSSDEGDPPTQAGPSQSATRLGTARDRTKPRVVKAETSKDDFWYVSGSATKEDGGHVAGESEVKGLEDEEWDVVREVEAQEERERKENQTEVKLGTFPL